MKEAPRFRPQPEYIEGKEIGLKSGSFLVEGASRSAIYDTQARKVYSINSSAAEILKSDQVNDKFSKQLKEMNLISNPETDAEITEIEHKRGLNFAWLEIEGGCNENCIHCYGLFGLEITKKEDKLTHQEWKSIITDISESGCDNVEYIGGEPLMYRGENREDVFDLIVHAKSVGIEKNEIFTNGTLLTEGKVKKCKELDVTVAISLYSIDSETHDSITQVPGSHRLTMRAIDLCKKYKVPLRIGFIAMAQNEHTIEETNKFIQESKLSFSPPDVVRPSGGGESQHLIPSQEIYEKYGYRLKPDFRTSPESFAKNIVSNPCYEGKIAILNNGDVIPCVFDRNVVMGNIKDSSLKEVLESESTLKNWENSMDNIMVCQDCEYRYACDDCRPLSFGANNNKHHDDAPPARCTYNPYEGTWNEGVWRLKDDKPVYLSFNESIDRK